MFGNTSFWLADPTDFRDTYTSFLGRGHRYEIYRHSNITIESFFWSSLIVEFKTRIYVSRAIRNGAAHGETAGRDGDGPDGTPTGRFVQETANTFILHTIE